MHYQGTLCNPMNLAYRFNLESQNYREAADPMVVTYKDCYYLFASKSGGYWWSEDLGNWNFVAADTSIDIERYAPSAWVMNGWLYYTSSSSGAVFRTHNPKSGHWEKVCDNPHPWNDPWLFLDDDGSLYAYFGSSENGTINCCQLDTVSFKPLTSDVVCIRTDTLNNGYERCGDNNLADAPTWTEGTSLLKYKGKYYLTYATPGTQVRAYCDGYYVSDRPMGPFRLADNSPMNLKNTGFVTGLGHGGMFVDRQGNLWTVDCVNLGVHHMFERRIALCPVHVDNEGRLYVETAYADYPYYIDQRKGRPDWQLLSYGKPVEASPSLEGYSPANIADENMRSWWSASTGTGGEWILMDLGSEDTVFALQLNFMEQDAKCATGRASQPLRYAVESSLDGKNWTLLLTPSQQEDLTHPYFELQRPVCCRYLRVRNLSLVPGNGKFAMSGLRVFGKGRGQKPEQVQGVEIVRNPTDGRSVEISWQPSRGAEGYLVRYGIRPDKLWSSYRVWGNTHTSCTLNSLQRSRHYYFRVDAVNDAGETTGTTEE
ncbi:MAG: family 43 glycosylhydrolase [Prevotella sp.]